MKRPSPLQNRVLPNGEIVAVAARGTIMGNRGGRIHDPTTGLLHPRRSWASKQWICCRLAFNNRHRAVMGAGYTELFFLDEVTALAAGHRPCFECRRADAHAYAEAVREAFHLPSRPRAAELDRRLHGERLDGSEIKRISRRWSDLPDGACFSDDGAVAMKLKGQHLRWRFDGYRLEARRETIDANRMVDCLTPATSLAALAHGYRPQWHPSAEVL